MEKISEKIQEKRALRLKELLESENISRAEASRRSADYRANLNMNDGYIKESELSDWIKGKRVLTEYKASQIIEEIAPEYRLSWLLGFDNDKTENDRILNAIDFKNIIADSMWGIFEKSLNKLGYSLKFLHREGQYPDAITRLKYDCYYEIVDKTSGELIKKLSTKELIALEEKLQSFSDFTIWSLLH